MSEADRKNLDKFEIKLEKVGEDVTHLLFIMQTDPLTKEPGLVERVRIMENTLKELLNRELAYKAKGSVWGILGGAFITALIWFGKYLITKFI